MIRRILHTNGILCSIWALGGRHGSAKKEKSVGVQKPSHDRRLLQFRRWLRLSTRQPPLPGLRSVLDGMDDRNQEVRNMSVKL